MEPGGVPVPVPSFNSAIFIQLATVLQMESMVPRGVTSIFFRGGGLNISNIKLEYLREYKCICKIVLDRFSGDQMSSIY